MIEKALQDARQLGRGHYQIRQLIEDYRPVPIGGARLAGKAAEETPPVAIFDVRKTGQALGYGLGEIAPLDLRR